jgi:hypothetical protein
MAKDLNKHQMTIASNPGKIFLKPWVYVKHFPFWGVSLGLTIFLSFGLLWFSPYYFPIIALLFSANKAYWDVKKDNFFRGDSNPGIVIQANPLLVAVATDLTKGIGQYPVVKVIKPPLKGFQQGELVSTVAVYNGWGNENLPYWSDFYPVVVNCATDDNHEIEQALKQYSTESIEILNSAISSITPPYKVGLYKVHHKSSDWKL